MRIIPVCAALFIFICAACAAAEDPKPNILFILADDLGLNGLSCCGNKFAATPNLDRLASEGMRFTQAYADSQCSPSRAAFFTGQFGARTGLFKVLNEKEPPKAFLRPPEECKGLTPQTASLASTLRSAGYATGISGKWHIADNSTVGALLKRDGGRYLDRYGFDFGGAAGGQKENKEDKAAKTITDDIIGFIEQNRLLVAVTLRALGEQEGPDVLLEEILRRLGDGSGRQEQREDALHQPAGGTAG